MIIIICMYTTTPKCSDLTDIHWVTRSSVRAPYRECSITILLSSLIINITITIIIIIITITITIIITIYYYHHYPQQEAIGNIDLRVGGSNRNLEL